MQLSRKTWATEWLQQQWLERWCTNDALRDRIHQLAAAQANDETQQLSRQEKNSIRQAKRGAFHAFLKQFVGDTHVAYTMLNHGFTTPAEFYNLLGELHRFKTSTRHAAQLREEEETNQNKEALRASAQAARSKFKQGKRIFMQIQKGELLEESLTGYQNRLCESFNDNSFYRQMIAANKAYGHGQGAERPDFVLRQHLELEYTTRALRDYF